MTATGSSYAVRWRTSARLSPRPGLLAVVSVLFGSTGFDTYKDTLSWQRFLSNVGLDNEFTNALALLVFCLIVGVSFTIAAMSTGVDTTGPNAVRRSALPGLLAHSVIPIIVGYMTAHYLSYLIEQGQATIIQLSDPMVRGDNLLGTANFDVQYWLSFHPSFLAVIQVVAVITGHIVASSPRTTARSHCSPVAITSPARSGCWSSWSPTRRPGSTC